MEIIKPGTRIDFMGMRRPVIAISLVTIVLLLALLPVRLNFGVDFAGGTEIEVRFTQNVDPAEVRGKIEEAGFHDASVQRFGDASENTYLVRVQRVSILSDEQVETLRESIESELGSYGVLGFELDPNVGDKIDLTTERAVPLEEIRRVVDAAGVQLTDAEEAIRDLTRGGQPAYQILTQGLSDRVTSALHEAFGADQVDVRRVEYVGPQVGQQLRNQGIMAVIFAGLAILLYIGFRFDMRFAPAALLALIHDVAVVMGYWVVTGREFNLTSIAVVLTTVGYSTNDTIVIFDRLREVLARNNGKSFMENMNIAVNESLSRTLITSGGTILALLGLILFTSGSLFDFGAAMIVGIISGSYSSVFICGPVAAWMNERMEAKEAARLKAEGSAGKAAGAS